MTCNIYDVMEPIQKPPRGAVRRQSRPESWARGIRGERLESINGNYTSMGLALRSDLACFLSIKQGGERFYLTHQC